MPSITRKTPSGRTRRDAAREDLLAATERLLADGNSFTAIGVAQICDTAGVARSAFYRYFADKSDLLLKLIEASTDNVFFAPSPVFEGEAMSSAENVATATANSFRVWREHAALMNAYFEVAAYDAEVGSYWNDGLTALIETFRERIERGQQTGQIRTTLDASTVAALIVRGGERIIADHVASEPESGDTEAAHRLADVVWELISGA
jgi:AcrR family transcriptional regulator